MKLLTIHLGLPLPWVAAPDTGEQWVLVRLHGAPVGMLCLERRAYEPRELAVLIARTCGTAITRHLIADGLAAAQLDRVAAALSEIPATCPQISSTVAWPRVTVAVCTRNGRDRIRECLDALSRLDYPPAQLEVLVVDNAPEDDSTERLVRESHAAFRYVREPRPGLDWARNRAILEASGEVVAFTDDDVSVDEGWVSALARVFASEPDAMAVTGLVVPDEIDTSAQRLFEEYGGFGRGVIRSHTVVDAEGGESAARRHGGTGKFGTGANMAFRRSLFDGIGLFDPALDVGTPTNGGGDLEMFYRVLRSGHLLVYEPSAIVRHRHRREYVQLRTQMENNGIGFYSYVVRSASMFKEERWPFVRLGAWWLWYWNVRRFLGSFAGGQFPRDLISAELRGSLIGLSRYAAARRQAALVLERFGPQQPVLEGKEA